MSMLSSVANRLYWLARYLERAEGTARIINSYSQLILDVPQGSELGWETLISTIDADTAFNKRYKKVNERNVLKFMIADTDNFSSLRFSVKAARENMRTTRDALPEEAWELVNELYLFVEENAEQSVARRNRFAFLEKLIAQCQQMQGLIFTTLSRDHSFTFLKIGRLVERADMTSRVLDVAVGNILAKSDSYTTFMPFLWSNVLLSLSANSAYRREIGPLIYEDDTINFVLTSPVFPRSMGYCINGLNDACVQLKNSNEVTTVITKLQHQLDEFSSDDFNHKQLHLFIDHFQQQLYMLNQAIENAWFITKK